eukprot:s207_g21.t1
MSLETEVHPCGGSLPLQSSGRQLCLISCQAGQFDIFAGSSGKPDRRLASRIAVPGVRGLRKSRAYDSTHHLIKSSHHLSCESNLPLEDRALRPRPARSEFTRSEYERPARHGSKINGWPVPNLLLYRIGWFNGVADSAVEGKLYKGQGMLLAGDALVCCWFDGQCAVVLQCLQLAGWGASEPAGQGGGLWHWLCWGKNPNMHTPRQTPRYISFGSLRCSLMVLRLVLVAGLLGISWAEERKLEVTESQGFAAGQTGEYFRYKHIFHKKPSGEDFQHAQKVAEEVRCIVCAKILASLLAKARSFSEDDIADVLEGNTEYDRTGDPVTDQMLKHKRGCNKHFKEGRWQPPAPTAPMHPT